jgi:hypothetical protein
MPVIPEPPGPHDPDQLLMPAFLAACPSLEGAWPEEQERWGSIHRGPRDGDAPGIYYDLGLLAHHLVRLLETDETREFPSVFAVVERFLVVGDAVIRYPVQVGLLEDLGNIASGQRGWPFAARFREWFGPATNLAWDELHEMWGTSDTSGTASEG